MPRLIWTPAALSDVQRLYRSLNSRNPQAAKDAVKAIKHAVRILERHPQAGRPAGDHEDDLRERVIGFGRDGYVALYRYDGEIVFSSCSPTRAGSWILGVSLDSDLTPRAAPATARS